jgi:RNA polymerase sigma-70 factor, ECF subfamily
MRVSDQFERVVVEQRRMLVRTAAVILRDCHAAEDAVQEALFKAWCRLDSFRGEAEFDTWLIRILVNQCKMQMRRSRSRRETGLDAARLLAFGAPNPEQLHLAAEIEALVRGEINSAPRLYRVALLADLAIFKTDNTLIAARPSGVRYGTAQTRRRRARAWLRARMERYVESGAI